MSATTEGARDPRRARWGEGAESPTRAGRSPLATGIRRAIFYVVLVAIWQAIHAAAFWPSYVLPGPADVARALLRGLQNGTLLRGIAVSLRRIGVGYGISIVVGIPLGFALARFRLLQETVGSLLLGLQTLPSICWLPLALLWFGLNERAILFVVVMGAVLSITLSAEAGIRNIPPLYLRAARTMGASGVRLAWSVAFPAALPWIVSGLKQGWSFAWRSLMAGELLFVTVGLGQLLMVGRELNDMSQVIAVMLVIVAIGVVIDQLVFAPVERSLRLRWGLDRA